MSETPAAQEKVQAPAKTRSPLERLVVWGGIILLGVVVFVEYSGQKNYNATVSWLEENEYKGKSLADVRTAAVGASESDVEITVKQTPKVGSGEAARDVPTEVGKSFRWKSLFKNYEMVATFQGEGDAALLTGFYNPEELKKVEKEMAAKFANDQEPKELPEGFSVESFSGGGGSGSSNEEESASEEPVGKEQPAAEGNAAETDESEGPSTEK